MIYFGKRGENVVLDNNIIVRWIEHRFKTAFDIEVEVTIIRQGDAGRDVGDTLKVEAKRIRELKRGDAKRLGYLLRNKFD